VERVDPGVLAQLRPVRDGAVDECAVRETGADDSALGLEQRRPAVRNADRPPLAGVLRRKELVLRARRVERCARALVEIADELQEPVQLEQLDSGLLLEPAPARERLPRELDELEVRICEPHDARAPVAGAARVPDLELLVQRDVAALAREGIRRRRAHDPRADYRDVGHSACGTAIWSCPTPRGPAR